MAPEIADVVSGEPVESVWGNAIRSRTVQRYLNDADRTTKHPLPTDGDLAFMEDTGKIEVFYSGSWRSLEPDFAPSTIIASVDEDSPPSIGTTMTTMATAFITIPAGWTLAQVHAVGVLEIGVGGGTVELQVGFIGGGFSELARSTADAVKLCTVQDTFVLGPGAASLVIQARRVGTAAVGTYVSLAYVAARAS